MSLILRERFRKTGLAQDIERVVGKRVLELLDEIIVVMKSNPIALDLYLHASVEALVGLRIAPPADSLDEWRVNYLNRTKYFRSKMDTCSSVVGVGVGTLLERLPMDLLLIISQFNHHLRTTISSPISIEEVRWTLQTSWMLTAMIDDDGTMRSKTWREEHYFIHHDNQYIYRDTKIVCEDSRVVDLGTSRKRSAEDIKCRPQTFDGQLWFIDVRSMFFIIQERLRKLGVGLDDASIRTIINQRILAVLDVIVERTKNAPLALRMYLQRCLEKIDVPDIDKHRQTEQLLAAIRQHFT